MSSGHAFLYTNTTNNNDNARRLQHRDICALPLRWAKHKCSFYICIDSPINKRYHVVMGIHRTSTLSLPAFVFAWWPCGDKRTHKTKQNSMLFLRSGQSCLSQGVDRNQQYENHASDEQHHEHGTQYAQHDDLSCRARRTARALLAPHAACRFRDESFVVFESVVVVGEPMACSERRVWARAVCSDRTSDLRCVMLYGLPILGIQGKSDVGVGGVLFRGGIGAVPCVANVYLKHCIFQKPVYRSVWRRGSPTKLGDQLGVGQRVRRRPQLPRRKHGPVLKYWAPDYVRLSALL